jgi:hypothetical protein
MGGERTPRFFQRHEVLGCLGVVVTIFLAMLAWVAIETRLPGWVAPSLIGIFIGFAVLSLWGKGKKK